MKDFGQFIFVMVFFALAGIGVFTTFDVIFSNYIFDKTESSNGDKLIECMIKANTIKEENICIITYEVNSYRYIHSKLR